VRVTENMIASNLLANARRAFSQMATAQERLSSGRRINRPSDDPSGVARALALDADLKRTQAYQDNASAATAFMSLTESSLQELSDHLSRAKELLVQGMNDPVDAGGAEAIATELRGILDEVVGVANREIGNRSLFGGQSTLTRPFERVGDRVLYGGDRGNVLQELGPALRVAVNLAGPTVFNAVPARLGGSVDLDPAISRITALADLRNGEGASGGHVQITDGNGVTADVDLLAATNLGQVIDGINNAGTAVVASLGTDGKTLVLTDTSGGASFSVSDLQGGDLARSLGIATTSDTGTITSDDLNPVVGEGTPTALLLAGAGLPPGGFTVTSELDGETRTATIDPSQANTVGDLLRLIAQAATPQGESLGLTAHLSGNTLVLESGRPDAKITVTDPSGGGSGAALGILGRAEPSTVFQLLSDAAGAVTSRDHAAMDALLKAFDDAVSHTAGLRGAYGARARQVTDITTRLADIEDADVAKETIDLTKSQNVYNAALAAGNQIMHRSLFDYLG
jgi:flagellar hook-associated protein 3 FlgL